MLYELMLVVNPKADSKSFVAKVEKTLKDSEASNINVSNLGKKPLSYPIAKNEEGEYVVFNFEAGPAAISPLNSKLRLEQEVLLRYLIIKSQSKGKVAPKKTLVTVTTKKEDRRKVKSTQAKEIIKKKETKPQKSRVSRKKGKKN